MNKEELKSIIDKTEERLNELKAIDYDFLKDRLFALDGLFNEFKKNGEALLEESDILQIGIVGQVNTGKSSFLNSLFFNGEDVLPKASTPMTAGLTILEYSERNTFEVEYFNETDWDVFVKQNKEYERIEEEIKNNPQNKDVPKSIIETEVKRNTSAIIQSAHEMVSSCKSAAIRKIGKKNDVQEFSDIIDLKTVLNQYVGANGEYTPVVKSLFIKMNDERLKGLRIVDTPGVNDPVVSRENRTRMFLHTCHGVFLLSSSSAFLSSCDVNFLNSRIGASGISTVILVASKFDSVLQNIGADYMMKNKPVPPLDTIKKEQIQRFKHRLNEISSTIAPEIRDRIKLTMSAGIAYSIVQKKESQWDPLERQVVAQMQRFFPAEFAEDRMKDSFLGLANMENIKNACIDMFFMQNKEAIVEEKIKRFFENRQTEIHEEISKTLEILKGRKEQLDSTTIGGIKKQKEMQERLFNSLKREFELYLGKFKVNLQENTRGEIANRIQFRYIRYIPTETTEGVVRCKGKLWGHNREKVSYQQVNTFSLQDQFEKAVAEYANEWNKEWKNLFKQENEALLKALLDCIHLADKETMSLTFDDVYYRDLIDRALNYELKTYKELKIRKIIDEYQEAGRKKALQSQYVPDGTDELKESQLSQHFASQLNNHNNSVREAFYNLSQGVVHDVKIKVNENLKGCIDEETGAQYPGIISVIDKMQTDFVAKIKDEADKYLSNLEAEINDQNENLKKIEKIIGYYEELKEIYR